MAVDLSLILNTSSRETKGVDSPLKVPLAFLANA